MVKKKRRKAIGWIEKPSMKQMRRGTGWAGELNECFVDKNKKYCIQIRSVETSGMLIEHAVLRNFDNSDIPWAEKQRIKNEIFGNERVAVEVFPAESELVDEAGIYHFWVYPEGYRLPFGI